MFIFGHMGITLGAALAGTGAFTFVQNRIQKSSDTVSSQDKTNKAGLIDRLSSFLDVRILLIGSMLPDIIDKPVGHFIFNDFFHNGRIFSHTLVFFLLFFIPGLWVYIRYRKTWLLAIAFGIFTHLILDLMWRDPRTLFWPYYGWTFPRFNEEGNILVYWLNILKRNPEVSLPELLGAVILGVFLVRVYTEKKLTRFIIKGKL